MFGKFITTTFDVKGMSCAHCEAAVQGALEALQGVKSAKASAKIGKVTVRYSPKEQTLEALRAAVCASGFDA